MKTEERIFKQQKIGFIIVLFFGLIFLIIGGIVNYDDYQKRYWDKVEATVVDYDNDQGLVTIAFLYDFDNDNIDDPLARTIDSKDTTYSIGETVKIRINPEDIDIENPEIMNPILPTIMYSFGALMVIISIVLMKSLKKTNFKREVMDFADLNISKELLNESHDYLDTNLIFQKDFSLKHGFVFKDEYNHTIYQTSRTKVNIFKGNTFNFINYYNNNRYDLRIGATTSIGATSYYQTRRDEIFCSFKINNDKCWTYLKNKGIKIVELNNDVSKPIYFVYKYNELIAILNPDKNLNNFIRKSFATYSAYQVQTCNDYLDDVFLVLFTLSRIFFYAPIFDY